MRSSEEPLVSVVTPVYNGARYLAECIDSVRAQTYENWEYVIVNNCSTDETLKIARSYARRDPRIRVHDNAEFLPVIQNFNNALRRMSGASEYCKVVHADDLLFPECISRMVALAEEHPNVGIVGAYALYGTRVKLDGLPYPSTVVDGPEICRSMLFNRLQTFGSPSTMLIRSEIMRESDAFYDEAELQADRAACYEVLQDWDYGFVHQVLTYVRKHDDSLTNTVARPLYAGRLADVAMMKRYGPVYLGADEYRECRAATLRRYYRILARNALRGRGRTFWSYHRDRLRQVGEPLDLGRLAAAVAGLVVDRALNPMETLGSAVRKLANGQGIRTRREQEEASANGR